MARPAFCRLSRPQHPAEAFAHRLVRALPLGQQRSPGAETPYRQRCCASSSGTGGVAACIVLARAWRRACAPSRPETWCHAEGPRRRGLHGSGCGRIQPASCSAEERDQGLWHCMLRWQIEFACMNYAKGLSEQPLHPAQGNTSLRTRRALFGRFCCCPPGRSGLYSATGLRTACTAVPNLEISLGSEDIHCLKPETARSGEGGGVPMRSFVCAAAALAD